MAAYLASPVGAADSVEEHQIEGHVYLHDPVSEQDYPKPGIIVRLYGTNSDNNLKSENLVQDVKSDQYGRYYFQVPYSVGVLFPESEYGTYQVSCVEDSNSEYEIYKIVPDDTFRVGMSGKVWWAGVSSSVFSDPSPSVADFYIHRKGEPFSMGEGKALKVTSPTSEQTWQAGSTHTITWTQTGLEGTNVRIELKDSISPFVQIRTVKSSTSASSGSYSWKVPDDVPAGSTYSIHVNSISDPSVGSYGWLTISAAPKEVTKTLKITSPTSEQTWQAGSTHTITWTQTGLEGTNVKIELKDSINPFVQIRTVTSSTPASSGSYSWKVPDDVPAGSTYSIHVNSISDPSVGSYGWLNIIGVIQPPAYDEEDEGTSCPDILPKFAATPVSGSVPLTVYFTDISGTGIQTWEWDFNNDGSIDSTLQNPVYVYDNPGVYTVTLGTTSVECPSKITATKDGYITVTAASSSLVLDSVPSGASVFVDGVSTGVTPLTIPDVTAGKHTIAFSLSGYKIYTTDLNAEPGRTITYTAAMVKIADPNETTFDPEKASVTQQGFLWAGAIGALTVAGILVSRNKK